MLKLFEWLFESVLGKLSLAGGAFLLVFGWWQIDRWGQREKGATRERARIERKAHDNVVKADAARDRVRSGGGGVLDPHLRRPVND